MAGGPFDSTLTRVEPFFSALFARDPSGRSWLPALLAATPNGPTRFGNLLESPGYLDTALAVRGVNGRLACFEHPAAPPRELLHWFIDHPGDLVWPGHGELSAETVRLRRALLADDPPGSQAKARERAHELVAARSPLSEAWWRFEGLTRLDCLLMTDRLVVTVEGKRSEQLSPATAWYPRRSHLVRTLEAARDLAGDRQWASLLISEQPLAGGAPEQLQRALPQAAPHLDPAGREELHAAYLGNLTWREACAAVELPLMTLPELS